jgi:hypothetical protein
MKLVVSLLGAVGFTLQAAPEENNYAINNHTPFHMLIAFAEMDITAFSASTYVPPNTVSTINTGGYCNNGYWIIPVAAYPQKLPTVNGNQVTMREGILNSSSALNYLLGPQVMNAQNVTWIGAGKLGEKVPNLLVTIGLSYPAIDQSRLLMANSCGTTLLAGKSFVGTDVFMSVMSGADSANVCGGVFTASYQPFTGNGCANRNITLTYDSATNTITTSNGYGAASVINHDYVS